MTYNAIGRAVANEVLEAMRLAQARFWYEWESRYNDLPQGRQEELQLELQQLIEACRASGGDWEHIDFDPTTGDGLDRAVWVIVWQDSATAPVHPVAIWLKVGTGTKAWEKIWPVSVPSPTPLSDEDPLPDAAEADPGVGTSASRWDHVHPLARPSKIRYYLSDTHGTGDWTGHLLLTSNPYEEGSAVDLSNAANLSQFVSPEGSPGLVIWNGGVVHAHLRIKLTGARVGRTYTLYMGNGDKVYTHLVGDYTSGDVYQTTPFPTEPAITETYATLDIDVPVATLAAGNTHRFELKLVLRAWVGDEEDGLDGEQIVVRVGGDNASYLDTPFTPDGGFAGLHNDLDGREASNAHPMSAITPGLITWDVGATVATVGGYLTMPPKTNSVRISGSETLLGISTAGMTPGTVIYVTMANQRPVANGQSVPVGYAAPLFHTALGCTASPSRFIAPAESTTVLELSGSSTWLVISAPWAEPQRGLWPSTYGATINTTDAPGLLELPAGCPGTIYVTGTALRGITAKDASGNVQAGPLAGLKLYFLNDCTIYHLDAFSGWDAGLAARAAKLDLLPPADTSGDAANVLVPARRTYRLQLDTFGSDLLWIPEVSQ